jgi:hypothetical protein
LNRNQFNRNKNLTEAQWAEDRFWIRAIKFWTDMHTLPATNLLRGAATRMWKKIKRFDLSPFYQVADALKAVSMDNLETSNPFTLAPWKRRIQTITDETATELEHGYATVRIAVSSSARNGVVGIRE